MKRFFKLVVLEEGGEIFLVSVEFSLGMKGGLKVLERLKWWIVVYVVYRFSVE